MVVGIGRQLPPTATRLLSHSPSSGGTMSPGTPAPLTRMLAFVLAVSALAGCGRPVELAAQPAAPSPSPSPSQAQPSTPSAKGPAIRFPRAGSDSWKVAQGNGAVVGRRGELLRYRVAVEKGI